MHWASFSSNSRSFRHDWVFSSLRRNSAFSQAFANVAACALFNSDSRCCASAFTPSACDLMFVISFSCSALILASFCFAFEISNSISARTQAKLLSRSSFSWLSCLLISKDTFSTAMRNEHSRLTLSARVSFNGLMKLLSSSICSLYSNLPADCFIRSTSLADSRSPSSSSSNLIKSAAGFISVPSCFFSGAVGVIVSGLGDFFL
mmetsp:Transcript_62745/g.99476  ORF Transcript_62745/g.99476 Transcript_62745/m.99476 type:complete len:205 (-) Transcript_62745:127-741(-)